MIKVKFNKRIMAVVVTAALMLALFPFTLSVSAAGEFTLNVNYDLELLSVVGEERFQSENSGKVVYMYSPGVSSAANAKKQSSEKWYPMYNDQIELKNYIPSTSTKDYVIAVRLADDIMDDTGLYQSRKTIILKGRPNISSSEFKRKAVYSPRTSMISISSDLKNMGYDYKIGECTWILGMTDDLYIDPAANFLGGSVTIRQTANDVTRTFSSNEYKVKIPASAKIPNVKVNEKTKRLIGIGKNQAWSARGDGSTDFTTISVKNIALDDIPSTLTKLENLRRETVTRNGSKVECYVIYFKTLADNKKPESPVQKVYIPVSLFSQQVETTPTDTSENQDASTETDNLE